MEKLSLHRQARRVSAPLRRELRKVFTRDRRETIKHTAMLARRAVIFTGVSAGIAAGGALGFDVVSHALGGAGISQGYRYQPIPLGECTGVVVIASHRLHENEDVSLHVRPEGQTSGVDFNLSGNPLFVGFHEFCPASDKLPVSGLIFTATSNGVSSVDQAYAVEEGR